MSDAAHKGWLYFNPDTGIEWSDNHPVESGEVPDAERVRKATLHQLWLEMTAAWQMLAEDRRAAPEPVTDADKLAGPAQEPVAWITKAGLANWLQGDGPENHVLLRTGGDLREPLYPAPPAPSGVDAAALEVAAKAIENALLPDTTKLNDWLEPCNKGDTENLGIKWPEHPHDRGSVIREDQIELFTKAWAHAAITAYLAALHPKGSSDE